VKFKQTIMLNTRLLASLAAVSWTLTASGVPTSGNPTAAVDLVKRATELKSLRWGLFVCWSFSSFSEPKTEWTRGVKDVAYFKATTVDTDQWVRTAKEAEMGYLLFLTKHHDGFCLWDTKTTERKITRAPLGRDVLADVRKSCDKYGIKLALYFSEGEFKDHPTYHPGGYTPAMKKAQLKELLTRYGPIEFLWMDEAQTDGGVSHEETTAWCHQWQPGTLVGYNSGEKSGEIHIRERGNAGPVDPKSGYLLGEFTYPILPDKMFASKWFYSLSDGNTPTHPAKKIYRDYFQASRSGTLFSLDVGPDHAGKLRALDVKTLREVGEMIRNPPRPPDPPPVSQRKPVKASSLWNTTYDAPKAFDGDEYSRWGAAKGETNGWLEVDLQADVAIDRVVIMALEFARRIEAFSIEYKDGDTWKEIARGATPNYEHELAFKPVTTRQVRLNIVKASDAPTLYEFQIFEARK
jgi:alpha-L-fucosidase